MGCQILHESIPISLETIETKITNPTLNLKDVVSLLNTSLQNINQTQKPNNLDNLSEDSSVNNWRFQQKAGMDIQGLVKLVPEYNGDEKTLDSFVKKINTLWQQVAIDDRNQLLLVLQLKLTGEFCFIHRE